MPRVDSRRGGVLVQRGTRPSQAGAVPGNAARVAAALRAQHVVCTGAIAAARRAAAMVKLRSAEEIEDTMNSERLVSLAGPISFRNWIVWRAGTGTRPRERVAMCTQATPPWRSTMALLLSEDWRLRVPPGPGAAKPCVSVRSEPPLGRGAEAVPRLGPDAEVDGWPRASLRVEATSAQRGRQSQRDLRASGGRYNARTME